jgi:hypothetical protein
MTTTTSSIKAATPGISSPTTRPPSPQSHSATGQRSSLRAVGINGETARAGTNDDIERLRDLASGALVVRAVNDMRTSWYHVNI